METRILEFIEKKGCITFSRVCVNLGKIADLETGMEKYYCQHNFPENCSIFGCPHMMPITDPESYKLRKLSDRELKELKDFWKETRRTK